MEAPSLFIISFKEIIDSASQSLPATARMAFARRLQLFGDDQGKLPRRFLELSRAIANHRSVQSLTLESVVRESRLSLIHSSFTSSFARRTMGKITAPLSTRMLLPKPSVTSMLGVDSSSHERAENANGLDVNAPTGQRSMTLPLNSLAKSLRRRPNCLIVTTVMPMSCTPAISVENRTQRVQ